MFSRLTLRKQSFNVWKTQQIWTVNVNFCYNFVEKSNTKYVNGITREDQEYLQDW